MVNVLTNTAIAAEFNTMEHLGLSADSLQSTTDIVKGQKRTVTLCFTAEETCTFVKESEVVIEQMSEYTVCDASIRAQKKSTVQRKKLCRRVKEYHWNVGLAYKICVHRGDSPRNLLQSRSSSQLLIVFDIQGPHVL